jgi:hypothetical protein
VPGQKPAEFQAALKRQQWMDLEQGLAYAQKNLI